jgi:hypothetical protein
MSRHLFTVRTISDGYETSGTIVTDGPNDTEIVLGRVVFTSQAALDYFTAALYRMTKGEP